MSNKPGNAIANKELPVPEMTQDLIGNTSCFKSAEPPNALAQPTFWRQRICFTKTI
ncbi:MAG: hypothetical protein V7K89_34575 [Nostoc sp.]